MKSLTNALKIMALFISLSIVNLVVMKFLSILGYLKFTEVNGILLSPLLTTILLVFIYKRQDKQLSWFQFLVNHFK